MFSGGTRLSFSKLKCFSCFLKVSFSSLRHTVYNENLIGKLNKNAGSFRTHNLVWNRYCSSSDMNPPFNVLNEDIQSIAKGDPELTKKLKVIILEVEVMRQEGLKVPSNMNNERWTELLNLPSRSQRLKTLAFWWLNEKKHLKDKKKKEEVRLKREALKQNLSDGSDTDHMRYGLGGSTIFLRIYDSTIDYYNNYKLIRAMMFGQDLVIDCSYDEHMTPKEASLCAKQLQLIFGDNRVRREPFNIHFCNAKRDSKVFTKLHKMIPTMYDDDFPLNITDKSFMDIFPKEKLVYLTPHCREELKEFNHDDIYIIGAMVDKVNVDPLSLGKAKSLGLRMAKLPLDRYLDWGIGGKSLTINQMLLILHELKSTGDWDQALKHVPSRKLRKEDERLYSTKNRGALKRLSGYKW